MVRDLSARCQVLPPSVDFRMPTLVIRTCEESVGCPAYSITIFPPAESVNGVFCQAFPSTLVKPPLSMSPATRWPFWVTASAHGGAPIFGETSWNERAPSLERESLPELSSAETSSHCAGTGAS